MKQKDMFTNGCPTRREGDVFGKEWVIFTKGCTEPPTHKPMEIRRGKNLYKSSG